MPNLFVIAGPNGAGKSTSAPELLTGTRRVDEFVNADVIAKDEGLSDIAAGRKTLYLLTELAKARRDLAFETTLASHLLLPRIRAMQDSGYVFPPGVLLDTERRRDLGGQTTVADNELWNRLVATYMKPRAEEPKRRVLPPRTFTSEDLIQAIDRAVRAALKRHKELGQSVVQWRDGRVVTVKAEDITI